MRFAQIGYGHDGRGNGGLKTGGTGYTYLVSDNVRKEQILQVIAHSHKKDKDGNVIPGRAFATTGQVLRTTSAQPSGAPQEITNAYTQKELGVKQGFGTTKDEREAEARYKALSVYNSEIGGVTGEEAEKKFAITGDTKTEKLLNEGYETYAKYMERTGGFEGGKK